MNNTQQIDDPKIKTYSPKKIVSLLHQLTSTFDAMGSSRNQSVTVSTLFFDSISEIVVTSYPSATFKSDKIKMNENYKILDIDNYRIIFNKQI